MADTSTNAPTPAGTADIGSLLGGLLGLGAQAGGAALSQAQIAQALSILGNLQQQYASVGYPAGTSGTSYLNSAGGSLESLLNGQNPYEGLVRNSLIPNIGQLNNLLPGLFNNNLTQNIPQASAASQLLGQIGASGYAPSQGAAQELLSSLGLLPGMGGAQGAASGILAGQNPNIAALSGGGQGILQNGGMTPAIQALLGSGGSLLGGAGTPVASPLEQAGLGLVGSHGANPQTQTLDAVGMAALLNQGASPFSQAMGSTGLQIIGNNPLLPMQEAASIAADQAGQAYGHATRDTMERLQASGQGPGAVVANGAGNSIASQFGDQGLSQMANAREQALLNQQALQSQLFGQGAGMVSGAQGLQQAMQQIGGGLVNSGQGLAQGWTGLGGNLATSGNQLGLEGLGLGGSLTGQGQQSLAQMLGLGSGMLGSATQGQLGGGSLLNNLFGTQSGNLGMGIQGYNQGMAGQQGALNSTIAQLLQGAQTGAGIGQGLASSYLGNQNALSQALFGGIGADTGAAQLLNGTGGTFLNYAGGLLSDMGRMGLGAANGLFSVANPWSQFLNNLGSQGSGIGSALKKLLGGGGSSGPAPSGNPGGGFDGGAPGWPISWNTPATSGTGLTTPPFVYNYPGMQGGDFANLPGDSNGTTSNINWDLGSAGNLPETNGSNSGLPWYLGGDQFGSSGASNPFGFNFPPGDQSVDPNSSGGDWWAGLGDQYFTP